jgi:hypothetical protein
LGVVETAWAPLHAELIKSAGTGRISAALTIEYAPFLVTQWMRTRTYRDTMSAIAQGTAQSICDDLVRLNYPEHFHLRPRVVVDKAKMAAMHAQKLVLV